MDMGQEAPEVFEASRRPWIRQGNMLIRLIQSKQTIGSAKIAEKGASEQRGSAICQFGAEGISPFWPILRTNCERMGSRSSASAAGLLIGWRYR